MKLVAEKSTIIKQVKKIDDPELIEAINKMVKYGLKKQAERDAFNIPEKQKQVIRKRVKRLNPDELLEWSKAEKKLKV